MEGPIFEILRYFNQKETRKIFGFFLLKPGVTALENTLLLDFPKLPFLVSRTSLKFFLPNPWVNLLGKYPFFCTIHKLKFSFTLKSHFCF